LILNASKHKDISSVALTSGIYPNNTKIIKKMCYIIKNVRKKLPNIPIGVEPYISNKHELFLLKKAGANEIKINVQIPDKKLFCKLCPNFSYEDTFKILEESVKIFGIGKVSSNIIYGVGESDRSILNAVERLAKISVVPTLRKIRINEFNRKKLEDITSNKLPNISISRILKIAHAHKKILVRNCLTTKTFETMCHKCGCCDIVPFWDI
jgi:biotin synthase-related radical SAM superfamily protein